MIDLSEIIYRSHEEGDVPEGGNVPNPVGLSANAINLVAIKFRANLELEEEEEE